MGSFRFSIKLQWEVPPNFLDGVLKTNNCICLDQEVRDDAMRVSHMIERVRLGSIVVQDAGIGCCC